MSFDKVHTMREDKIRRGMIVTNLLFAWVDRHKGKAELKKQSKKAKKVAKLKRKSLHVEQKHFKSIVTKTAEIKRQRISNRVKAKVARTGAKKKFCEMILYPESYSFHDDMNPREHFLVSKYFKVWEDLTFKKENLLGDEDDY